VKKFFVILALVCLFGFQAFAQQAEYLQPQPLSQVVKVSVRPVSTTGATKVPTITWGGDIATVLAEMEGFFRDEGWNVTLFREDNFAKQVEMCLSGETPFLRGTMGMINAAADAFKAHGQELVVIYQMTWSVGGDAMVVRKGKKLSNIKTVALQLYGPHMDYAANLFANAKRLDKVQFKYLKELYEPDYDTRGKIVDPVSAFRADSSLDAVMCIIPDALALSSGGTVGDGSEGSVKGAKIELSTKTASRIISDVYAVRKDYFDANRSKVQGYVKALMRGEEALRDLLADKASNQAKYRQLISKSATLLLGAPTLTGDTEALLGDCEYVGHAGNIAFFTGKGTSRTLATLTKEIQASFRTLGLMTGTVPIASAGWDYNALGSGLKYAVAAAAPAPAPKKAFDTKKVARYVESKVAAEAATWEEEGTLFKVEIFFDPNQNEFPVSRYSNDYQEALSLVDTNRGALITIEGHTNPYNFQKREQEGASSQELAQIKQTGKNLSLQRAQAVRNTFLAFAKNKGVVLDETRFYATGRGIDAPKHPEMKTKQQWNENRRVVFLVKQIEAEAEEFVPLKK